MNKKVLIWIGLMLVQWLFFSWLMSIAWSISYSKGLTSDAHIPLIFMVYWWIALICIKLD